MRKIYIGIAGSGKTIALLRELSSNSFVIGKSIVACHPQEREKYDECLENVQDWIKESVAKTKQIDIPSDCQTLVVDNAVFSKSFKQSTLPMNFLWTFQTVAEFLQVFSVEFSIEVELSSTELMLKKEGAQHEKTICYDMDLKTIKVIGRTKESKKYDEKIDKMMKEMFRLQNHLNNETNGEQWVDGATREGRQINWKRCLYMEGSELLNSFGWKHWKGIDNPDDIENAKVELVDIWHFIMSDLITRHHNEFSIDEIAEIARMRYEDNLKDDSWKEKTLIELSEAIIKNAINGENVTTEFFNMIKAMPDFTFEDVYKLYIGKNCLNQFRQDNGYKDGSYIKIWNGKEDNVYMQQIMEENPDIGFELLYAKLGVKYKNEVLGM